MDEIKKQLQKITLFFSFEGPVDIILALTLVTLKLTSMNNDYFNQYKKKLQLHFFFTSRPHGDHVSVTPILGINY